MFAQADPVWLSPEVWAAGITASIGAFVALTVAVIASKRETRKTREENRTQHGTSANLLAHLSTQVNDLAHRTDSGFARVDTRLDGFDTRILATELAIAELHVVDASTTVHVEAPKEAA